MGTLHNTHSYIETGPNADQHYTGSYSINEGSNKVIVRRGLNQLYYSNFETGSGIVADNYNTDLQRTGSENEDIRIVAWDNYLESSYSVSGSRKLATRGAVYSIPKDKYGTHIEPGSVILSHSIYYLVDDAEGNLRTGSTSGDIVGNVIYGHGQVIVNHTNMATIFESGALGGASPSAIDAAPGQVELTWKSNVPVYTSNFNIKLSDYEYNYTLNPTAQSGSTTLEYSGSSYFRPSGILADNVTGSDFQPYITTIGLYNDSQDLLAIGKLAQPVRKPADTEMSILVKIDI